MAIEAFFEVARIAAMSARAIPIMRSRFMTAWKSGRKCRHASPRRRVLSLRTF